MKGKELFANIEYASQSGLRNIHYELTGKFNDHTSPVSFTGRGRSHKIWREFKLGRKYIKQKIKGNKKKESKKKELKEWKR